VAIFNLGITLNRLKEYDKAYDAFLGLQDQTDYGGLL
jgi:hypothetical protein